MPIKMANNASGRLAAPLENTDTTIVLVMDDIQPFPALAAGEWHPLTVTAPNGAFEIVRVTNRSSNLLTVDRAQEGTTALNFDVDARAEIRLTSAALHAMQSEMLANANAAIATARAEVQASATSYTDAAKATLRTELSEASAASASAIVAARTQAEATANGYTEAAKTTLRNELSTAIAGERSTSAGEISSLTATVGTKFDKAGGTITGNVTVTADITTYRPSSPGTGVIFFGNSGARYLHYDGSSYVMPNAPLYVQGSAVWHAGNFNPANYMPLTGANFSGNFGIYNTSPTIMFYDTDWGPRQVHCNSGLIGFLNSGGGWSCYSQDDGTFIASGNIGAYSDRKHKTDIETIGGALALVERLRGVTYTDKRTGARRVGVIAQEVQEHLPEVVGEGPDGLHVDYGNIVGALIEAVKELAIEIRTLKWGL